MIHQEIYEFTQWNKITKYAISIDKVRFTSKLFVQQVINPLVELDLIESEKTTTGRGAKANSVRLTLKARNELVASLLKTIASQAEISETELNRSFEDVLSDLDNDDKHIKGKALELLAIWMIRLTSLRFTKWRKRDVETGDGEVDVLAGSDRFVYSRWQIQCKNTKKVDVDVLAKEIGMTFVTGADVVMIVTTGEFTRSAYQYAYRMMEVSRYYMILLQRDDIEEIKKDKTNIVKILDKKARRVFAKKELSMTDEEINEIEEGELSITDEDVNEVEEKELLIEVLSD
jgi:site-specific DNA-methyltransferase (cytosine-N4-specific)